jgi:hypothetical protein
MCITVSVPVTTRTGRTEFNAARRVGNRLILVRRPNKKTIQMFRPDDAWTRCEGHSSAFAAITILWWRAGSSARRLLTYASATSPAAAIHSATNARSSGVSKRAGKSRITPLIRLRVTRKARRSIDPDQPRRIVGGRLTRSAGSSPPLEPCYRPIHWAAATFPHDRARGTSPHKARRQLPRSVLANQPLSVPAHRLPHRR